MNTRTRLVLLSGLSLAWLSPSVTAGLAPVAPDHNLALSVRPDSKRLLPGEELHLAITAKNVSAEPVSIHRGSTVGVGRLKVYIAASRGEYLQYIGPGWGADDVYFKEPYRVLQPGDTFETAASLLWNARPREELARVSKEAAARLNTDFAFNEPGVYLIKVVLMNDHWEDWISSEPVRVRIIDPEGDDLEVWKILRGHASLAYFLHTSSFPAWDDEQQAAEVSMLEDVVRRFPASHYVQSIQKCLRRYQERRANRTARP